MKDNNYSFAYLKNVYNTYIPFTGPRKFIIMATKTAQNCSMIANKTWSGHPGTVRINQNLDYQDQDKRGSIVLLLLKSQDVIHETLPVIQNTINDR